MRHLLAALLASTLILETTAVHAQPPSAAPTPIPTPPEGVQVIVVDGAPAGGMERQQWLELRLRELQVARSQYRVGGPIALMAVGGAVLLIFGTVALGYRAANSIDPGGGGPISGSYSHTARNLGFVALGGAIMMVVGAVLLPKRLRQRRQYDPEIRDIRRELRMLRQSQPRYGFAPILGARTAGLSFQLSF